MAEEYCECNQYVRLKNSEGALRDGIRSRDEIIKSHQALAILLKREILGITNSVLIALILILFGGYCLIVGVG